MSDLGWGVSVELDHEKDLAVLYVDNTDIALTRESLAALVKWAIAEGMLAPQHVQHMVVSGPGAVGIKL